MNPLILGILLSLPVAEPPEVRTLCAFDGHPDDEFRVKGTWVVERKRELVRSGTGSVRVTLAPPEQTPGIFLRRAIDAGGWAELVVDVYNPGPKEVELRLRLDDAGSKDEKERYRTSFDLTRGWNRVAVPLDDLVTTSGSRRLDPAKLRYVILWCWKPKVGFDLVFDHLRLERPAGAMPERRRRQLCRTVDRSYALADTVAARRRLVAALRDADAPERCRVLHKRVLTRETDARLLQDAVRVLGSTRRSAAIEEALRLTDKARGRARWLWLDALGRMPSAAARDHVRRVAGGDGPDPDRVAAIRALVLRNDPSLVPLCGADRDGGWQVRAARVAALRSVVVGQAFPALTGYLKDEAARVRIDAQSALAALAGRDLGDDAAAWIRWREVNRTKLGGTGQTAARLRSPYGTYYGLPLYPGRLCFVIDVSGSMNNALGGQEAAYVARSRHLKGREIATRLDLVRAEARHAIEVLPERTQVQLVWFEDGVLSWSRRGVQRATRANKLALGRKLDTLVTGGGTNIHGGLVRAFVPDDRLSFKQLWAGSADTIYLLSDGEPTAGEITDRGHLVLDVLERNRVRMVKIHTIGMGRRDNAVLRDLAARTGGTYVDLAR